MNKIEDIITLLEGVANGVLDPNIALQRWPSVEEETDNLIKTAWHDLSHFCTDEDIRKKDWEYDQYQRGLLREKLEKIRERIKE